MTSFNTVVSNELEEVHMIAGDEKRFYYTIYDEYGRLVNLTGDTCTVFIFPYGDVSTIVATLSGSVSPAPTTGEFYVDFPSASSSPLSGIYQQQIKIVDIGSNVHRPAQGKIVIFPTPQGV